MRQQGLTELSFESAEPSFDKLSPESFFDRFPEGEYEISGLSIEGGEMKGATYLTHVMPAPPIILSPAPADCDSPTVVESGDLTITWEAVTTSHPMIGKDDQNIEIVGYEVFLELVAFPLFLNAVIASFVKDGTLPRTRYDAIRATTVSYSRKIGQ